MAEIWWPFLLCNPYPEIRLLSTREPKMQRTSTRSDHHSTNCNWQFFDSGGWPSSVEDTVGSQIWANRVYRNVLSFKLARRGISWRWWCDWTHCKKMMVSCSTVSDLLFTITFSVRFYVCVCVLGLVHLVLLFLLLLFFLETFLFWHIIWLKGVCHRRRAADSE